MTNDRRDELEAKLDDLADEYGVILYVVWPDEPVHDGVMVKTTSFFPVELLDREAKLHPPHPLGMEPEGVGR